MRRRWVHPDPSVEPRARMLVMHGIGEHSGRYEHVGEHFAAAGFDVRAHDHRGFGRTWGRRAYVESFSEFLDDVEDHLAELRDADPALPVVLLGHSLGGLICTAYCVDDRPLPDVLVTSGAALHADVPGWQRKAAPVLGRLRPTMTFAGGDDYTVLSTDVAVQEGFANDPLVVKANTARLGHEIFEAMKRTNDRLDRLTLPNLVLHGADDTLVPPSATEPLAARPNVVRHTFPGMRHEIFNEPGGPEVLGLVVEWLDGQLR